MTPTERAELRRLERSLAYSTARSDVEVHCLPGGAFRDRWYDPDSAAEEDRETVATAMRYLELRGLLERHPSQPWVRVREEA